MVVMSDTVELLKAELNGSTLVCTGDGYPRPSYQWIEINANNTVYEGQQLDFCNTNSLQRQEQRALSNESELIFQCVAWQDSHKDSMKLNYSLNASLIDRLCQSHSQPPGTDA
jgi:hypothetical protein